MLNATNVVAAFTEHQVERLTGLSKRQLRYWDSTGFFSPAHVEDARGFLYGRLYSFKNIVALRTLAVLRVQHNVPLQHLRKVAERLNHLRDDLWTQTKLWVLNRKVVFENPETGLPQEVVSGQYVIDIPLSRIVDDTRRDVERMRERAAEQIGRIVKERNVVGSAPVIAGTRIPVRAVQSLHEDGYSVQDIIREYPDLTEADVAAAVQHGRASVAA